MSVTVMGVAMSVEDAGYRPKKSITTDVQSISSQTTGKFFIGVECPNDGTQFALQMIFDGEQTEIKENEKGFGTSSDGYTRNAPYEAYPVDFPMRKVKARKEPYTVQFLIGKYEGEEFKESSRSEVFEINVPSETPSVKYDPKKDGD